MPVTISEASTRSSWLGDRVVHFGLSSHADVSLSWAMASFRTMRLGLGALYGVPFSEAGTAVRYCQITSCAFTC